ncbi:dynein axonemal heavy chain 12-like [Tubulanus polymorphus]|uniref:dynein axonemal heavy chain 12-like n=1 Tax=Tubulanus polymorphus TaxID=672921 RepID=UPI003DA3E1BD
MDLRGRTCPVKCSSISEACEFGKAEDLRCLLAQGMPVDVQDNCGWRPIHKAALKNHTDCLKILIDQGESEINWRGYEYDTPLFLAVKAGAVESTHILLKYEADCNLTDHMQSSPLHIACENRDFKMIQLLLTHGASVNAVDFNGETPLFHTIRHQPYHSAVTSIVSLLLEYGTKIDLQVDDNNATAIFEAAMYGYDDVLKQLLEYARKNGLDGLVDVTACDNASPLYLAAQNGHLECVRLLLNYGADVNIVSNEPRAVALYSALQFHNIEIAKLIVDKTSIDVFSKCDLGPFEYSTLSCDTTILESLIEKGLDVNQHFNFEVEAFIPRIFNMYPFPWMYDIKASPLVAVILSGGDWSHKHVKILLQAGSLANSQSAYDLPPLLAALSYGKYEDAKLLLEYGAHVNIYHPGIVFNASILVSIPFPRVLKLILSQGAELSTLLSAIIVKHCTTTNSSQIHQLEIDKEYSCFHSQRISFSVALDIARSRNVLPPGYDIVDVIKTVLDYLPSRGIEPSFLGPLTDKHDVNELENLMASPSSLLHLSRLKIRSCILLKDLQTGAGVKVLQLPDLLKQYLLYDFT